MIETRQARTGASATGIVVLVLIVYALLHSATAQPASVAVYEKGGELTSQEIRLLEEMDHRGIELPDSIVVLKATHGRHGYVQPLVSKTTVHLTTLRRAYPDTELPSSFPYLMGRGDGQVSDSLFPAYVLAHEIGHVHDSKLMAEAGRPAYGLHARSHETQAEILAAVYMDMAFGVGWKDLGFPAKIDYPLGKDKTVPRLDRQYCLMVNKTWSAELSCKPDTQK